VTSIDDPARVLDQLEGFLRQDPGNASLLAQAFDLALASGQHQRAQAFVHQAMARGPASPEWRLREAHLLMARHQWADALDGLASIDVPAGHPHTELLAMAVAGDVAYVCLSQGEFERGLKALRPWIDAAGANGELPKPLEQTWLRLLHRLDRLDEAMAWALQRWQAGALHPASAGVASLVALDASDFAACGVWAEAATAGGPAPVEALVARASLALGQQQPEVARRCLDEALRTHPDDGRVLSAMAFASLLAGDLAAARGQFELALQRMPDHIGTWHGLGWTCLLAGDVAASRAAFEAALDLDRNFAESHGGLAVALARLGEREAAHKALQRARMLDAGCASAAYAQAILDGTAESAAVVTRLARRAVQRGRSI
jgi:tetratricopeptide (TPR) repeat protein